MRLSFDMLRMTGRFVTLFVELAGASDIADIRLYFDMLRMTGRFVTLSLSKRRRIGHC